LVKLTRDSDSETAGAAIVALGKIATPAALKELTNLRASAAPGVQNAVTEGLLRVAGQLALTGDRPGAAKIYADLLQPSEPTHIRRAVLAALIRLDRDGGEARVLKVLRGQDAVLMPVSIAAIPALPGKGASARFAAELPRLTPTERVWLIESLAARADAPARKAIASQLTASETAVRVAAIQALGGYGDAAAVPSLTRALTQAKAPSEREAASLALTALRGGEGVDRALLAELKPAAPATRVDLIGILARRANPIAVPALLEQAGSPDATVARAAFNALGSLATPAELPALVDQLAGLRAVDARAEAEGAVARTVVRIPEVSQRSVAVRARLAATSEVAARCSLLRILSSAGDAAALGALNAAKTDANAEVRDAAIRTLALWPDAAVWESLVGVMHQPERETYRVLALRGLVRLAGEENARPSPSLVERYRQLFGAAKNDEDRKLILGALSACNHPDALQLAVAQLANAGVRAEAEQAVKKIAQGVKAQHPQIAQDALQKLQSK
jgi:HEAT repeat protein